MRKGGHAQFEFSLDLLDGAGNVDVAVVGAGKVASLSRLSKVNLACGRVESLAGNAGDQGGNVDARLDRLEAPDGFCGARHVFYDALFVQRNIGDVFVNFLKHPNQADSLFLDPQAGRAGQPVTLLDGNDVTAKQNATRS